MIVRDSEPGTEPGDESWILLMALPGGILHCQVQILGQFLVNTASDESRQALDDLPAQHFYDGTIERVWRVAQTTRPATWHQLVGSLHIAAGRPISPDPLAQTVYSLVRSHTWVSNASLPGWVRRYADMRKSVRIAGKLNAIVRELNLGDLTGTQALEKIASIHSLEQIYA